jgi:dTDP-4-dehydrorhamnose reductase
MRKIYVTGYNGYVGRELVRRGFLPLECDVTNQDAVERAINKAKPELLIHLASKSDVDFCEKPENENKVIRVNVIGTANVFKSLSDIKLPGVLMSTDQVWGGGYFERHREDSRLTPATNFYGMSKVSAEAIALGCGGKVVRTSYLFDGARLKNKEQSAREGLPQAYPVFIRRSFLHLYDFCNLLENYCERFYKMPKVLHLTGSKTVSWYAFMKEVSKCYSFSGWNQNPVKPRYVEKKGFAPRPWFGGLDITRAFELGFPEKDYLDGIKRLNES